MWTEHDRAVGLFAGAASYYRSLFHLAEASRLADSEFLVASLSASYYSCFHLGIAHILCSLGETAVPELPRAWQDRIRDRIRNRDDPASAIEHAWLRERFQALRADRQMEDLNRNLNRLRGMRDTMHYGPRLREGEDSYEFDSCRFTASEISSAVKSFVSTAEDMLQEFYDCCTPSTCLFLGDERLQRFYFEDRHGIWPYFGVDAREAVREMHAGLQRRVHEKLRSLPPGSWTGLLGSLLSASE